MATMPDATSSQASLGFTLGSTYPSGTVLHVVDTDGESLAAFDATKEFASFVLSTPDLEVGAPYEVLVGGAVTVTALGGYAATGDTTGAESLGSTTAATS